MKTRLLVALLIIPILFSSCDRKKKTTQTATMQINFIHKVDGQDLIKDQMIYTNAAGNRYEVTEIMYFISDLKLHRSDGSVVEPATWDDIHYIDLNIPSTQTWMVTGEVPAGKYDSITFTFGISQAKNKSFLFVNPPEVNMAWPDILGGGYHYLMINGWWLDLTQARRAFNFHLGIGQIYRNNSGLIQDIIGFIHNAFSVKPLGPGFTVNPNQKLEAALTMHIESWFSTPYIYNHNYWGGAIMQNQAAMQMGCENGKDVFTVSYKILE